MPPTIYTGKVLTSLIAPLPLAVLILLLGRRSRLACGTAAIILLILGSGQGSQYLTRTLESQFPPQPVVQQPTADAIVVLGGGLASQRPGETTQLSSHADRLWAAAQLYKAQKAPLILISGGSEGTPESVLAAEILQAWGIPLSAILTEEISRDTHQNALFSERILVRKHLHSILLVTSALHMPRAFATFRKTGLEVHAVPTDFQITEDVPGVLLRLIPSPNALSDSAAALKEHLGLAVYRNRQWAQ